MTATELQDALAILIENLSDARDEVAGEDDDATLADIARDMVSEECGELEDARTFESAQVLTTDAGLIVRTRGGEEFQITIVQSR